MATFQRAIITGGVAVAVALGVATAAPAAAAPTDATNPGSGNTNPTGSGNGHPVHLPPWLTLIGHNDFGPGGPGVNANGGNPGPGSLFFTWHFTLVDVSSPHFGPGGPGVNANGGSPGHGCIFVSAC